MKYAQISGIINTEEDIFTEFKEISQPEYESRLEKLRAMAQARDIDVIVVYGDREHFASLEYLTGYDPRFEESLLILKKGKTPDLIVGLEGKDYSNICPYELNRHVYSGFGLQGQPRDNNNLLQVLRNCGLSEGMKVGIIGWKFYDDTGFSRPEYIFDIPHYILETFKNIVGDGFVQNVTDIMINNENGLRLSLSPEEIIRAEVMNTLASRQVYNVIRNLCEGMSEFDATKFFDLRGNPMSTHPSLSFGKANVALGLASVRNHTYLKKNDIVSVGLGYRQAMIHRSAFFVNNENELAEIDETMPTFYKQYFELITTWYEKLEIGITGGEIYNQLKFYIEPMGIVLNMGHQIHSEEWINSLFYENSRAKIQSGMAIQCDLIGAKQNPYATVHVEDGIIIADEALRKELERMAPKAYKRIINRQKFMRETLRINIRDEILPLSDIQGMLFIFMENSKLVVTN